VKGRAPPPWIFGLCCIPFGVGAMFCGVALPKLLRDAGVPVEKIAGYAALVLAPAAWQFLWAPIIDLGPRRRSWLIAVSLVGGLAFAAALLLPLPARIDLFVALSFVGSVFTGLVGSCCGGLMATTLEPAQRGPASGWYNAGNLGGAALGGGMVLTLGRLFSARAAAVGVLCAVFLPALAALWVPEEKRPRRALGQLFRAMFRDVARTVRRRDGWTGILFCLSPVGSAALLNLFSAVARDYGASDSMTEFINGYWGGLITAVGSLFGGYLASRMRPRTTYLIAGGLTAVSAAAMIYFPLSPVGYAVGGLAYLFVAGICYAAFSAVVLEAVGQAGDSAATQYTLFTAAGNMAISYVAFVDGLGYAANGIAGLLGTDALLNLAGIGLLVLVLSRLRPEGPPQAAPAALASAARADIQN